MLQGIIILSLGVLSVQAGGGSFEHHIKSRVDTFNILSNCWGKQNMLKFSIAYHKACEFCEQLDAPLYPGGYQTLPADSNQIDALRVLLGNPALANLILNSNGQNSQSSLFGRKKRQANGLLSPTEEDKQNFLMDFADFKMGMKTKIGNLTCVMTQLKMLDANGDINIRQYTDGIWDEVEKTNGAADPAFVKKVTDGYDDCYKISQSWPQQSLNRNPLFKKHGRHMIFFECAKKVEHKMCYMYQVKEWLDIMYGEMDHSKYGFPEDQYDAAAMIMKVKYESATDEMRFVDEALWGKSKFE